MPWTSPKTWVVADVLTAADMNVYVRDNEAYLRETSSVWEASMVCGSGTVSTIGTVATVPGWSSPGSFVKHHADTQVLVEIGAGGFVGAVGMWLNWGVRLGSTDYFATGNHYFNAASDHRYWFGRARISGLAAGTYSVTGIWKKGGGPAGNGNVDGNDLFSLTLREHVAKV